VLKRASSVVLNTAHYNEVWKTLIPGHTNGKDTAIGFKDYAPLVFRCIRQLFGVSDADYMLSLGPEQILGELLVGTMGSLSELFSEGKSGSFFYFSNDGRYLIKTIPHRELLSLISILPQYYAHIEKQPHTLLPRFMGAHRLRLPKGNRKVHFIVMTNVFSTARVIHHRYDLKGSTHGRTAGADVLEKFPDVVRKDLDLQSPFCLKPEARESLIAQIRMDLNFLREVYTIDYSLLCGVHFPDREELEYGGATDPAEVAIAFSSAPPSSSGSSFKAPDVAPAAAHTVDPQSSAPVSPSLPEKSRLSRAGIETPGRARLPPRTDGLPPWVDHPDGAIEAPEGSSNTETEPVVYFIGVIDILTGWTCLKSLENIVKTMTHPTKPNAHSCKPPLKYASRFERAMASWFSQGRAPR